MRKRSMLQSSVKANEESDEAKAMAAAASATAGMAFHCTVAPSVQLWCCESATQLRFKKRSRVKTESCGSRIGHVGVRQLGE